MENPSIGCYDQQELIDLPPGFRFHPTDEELISHYLSSKALDVNFSATAIGEADLNKCEPWDLPKVAKMGVNEWYFFSQKDRKYPTGQRTNRATGAGYWKATGKDKEIYKAKSLVGMKKTLVFYHGRAPRGEKTNWIMHEFRLFPSSSSNEWVICRVFHKKSGEKKSPFSSLNNASSTYIDQASFHCSDQEPVPNPNCYYFGKETGYPVYQPQPDPFNQNNLQCPFVVSFSQDTGISCDLINHDGSSGVSSYDVSMGPFVGRAGPSGSIGSLWGFL